MSVAQFGFLILFIFSASQHLVEDVGEHQAILDQTGRNASEYSQVPCTYEHPHYNQSFA
jgi:hypothetical protein